MRKFYLENENQVRFDMNTTECFFSNPSGLGLATNTAYIKVGSYYQLDNQEDAQGKISGKIVFAVEQYENYRKFINFIQKSKELKLIYIPLSTEYFRDIDVIDVEKSEISEGALECPITFSCKSFFYTSNQRKFIIEPLSDEPRFDTAYWGLVFNDYSNREIIIDNTGHLEAGIKLDMYGYLINPKVELWYNNELTSTFIAQTTIEIGERLLYSSVDNDLFVKRLKSNGEEENLLSVLDLNNENFFKLPVGTSILKVTADNGVETKITVEVLFEYKGV